MASFLTLAIVLFFVEESMQDWSVPHDTAAQCSPFFTSGCGAVNEGCSPDKQRPTQVLNA
eukprot:4394574-Amphidinium_carterae.1